MGGMDTRTEVPRTGVRAKSALSIVSAVEGNLVLLARKPAKLVAVAVANKLARVAWAIMAKGGTYRAPALAAAA